MIRERKEVKYKAQGKGDFVFTYTTPTYDWYQDNEVKIKEDDYYYFILEKRYGNTWWLIGEKMYEWGKSEEKQLGEIATRYNKENLARFIEWAKTERGSRIVTIRVLSGNMNLIEEIKELADIVERYKR